jgi:hypothetical protein
MCVSDRNRLTLSFCRHIKMYPRGNEVSTRSMSLYLYLQDELPRESGPMIELTLTILNQIYVGECYNYKLQGLYLHDSLIIVDLVTN